MRSLKIKISKLGVLYVLTMLIAEVHQSGIFNGYYLTSIMISILWIGIGILHFLSNNIKTKKREFKESYIIIKCLIFPWIVFFIYNCFLYIFDIGNYQYIKSSFIQIMFTPCIVLGAISSYYLFGKNTLRYILYSIFLYYIVMLPILFIKFGPSEFLYGTLGIITSNGYENPFESNSDLVLALGILIIFYFDKNIRKTNNVKNHFLIILLLLLLGDKRITLIAIVFLFLVNFLTKFMSEKKQYNFRVFISLCILIGMYIFVYLVISGNFSRFIYAQQINTMGRVKMWDYIARFAQFSPSYLGKGYSFSNLTLEYNQVLTFLGKVYVLHSDVLKIYFDLGFSMFSFWGIYNLIIFPKQIRKSFGYSSANLIWSFIIYLFILYFTDNAINYFITQTIFTICSLRCISIFNSNADIKY